MVGELAKKLPFLSRQAVLFTNHVITKPIKEQMMQAMIDGYKTDKGLPEDQARRKADDYSNSIEGERDDGVLRINVCGTSTYECDEDKQ